MDGWSEWWRLHLLGPAQRHVNASRPSDILLSILPALMDYLSRRGGGSARRSVSWGHRQRQSYSPKQTGWGRWRRTLSPSFAGYTHKSETQKRSLLFPLTHHRYDVSGPENAREHQPLTFFVGADVTRKQSGGKTRSEKQTGGLLSKRQTSHTHDRRVSHW